LFKDADSIARIGRVIRLRDLVKRGNTGRCDDSIATSQVCLGVMTWEGRWVRLLPRSSRRAPATRWLRSTLRFGQRSFFQLGCFHARGYIVDMLVDVSFEAGKTISETYLLNFLRYMILITSHRPLAIGSVFMVIELSMEKVLRLLSSSVER